MSELYFNLDTATYHYEDLVMSEIERQDWLSGVGEYLDNPLGGISIAEGMTSRRGRESIIGLMKRLASQEQFN